MEQEEQMWKNEPQKESKGIWAQLQEAPVHKVEFNLGGYTLEQMEKDLEAIAENERKRRERMDKEYTDISTIEDSDIDELRKQYGEKPSAGIRVKLKIGGMYGEYPLQFLYTLQDAIKKEYEMRKKSN